jgi:hypothetical protein
LSVEDETKKDTIQEVDDTIPIVEPQVLAPEESPKSMDIMPIEMPHDRLRLLEDTIRISLKQVIDQKLLDPKFVDSRTRIDYIKKNILTLEIALKAIDPVKKDLETTLEHYRKQLENQ